MKKTLIALAVTASAVSGMAHAWSNGDFNGSVDIGGSITADDYRQKWSWQVGSDINGFNNALADLTDGGTKLTIVMDSNKPLFLGKTNEAFSTPVTGGLGAIPRISLSDSTGTVKRLKGTMGSGNGVGTIELEIKDRDTDTKIGTLDATMTAKAVAAIAGVGDTGYMRSLYAYSGTHIFSGGLVRDSGAVSDGSAEATGFVHTMGSLGYSELLAQIQKVKPNVQRLSPSDTAAYENMHHEDGNVVSAAYALGFERGQTIKANFDKPITASTQWTAPLNVAVTYY